MEEEPVNTHAKIRLTKFRMKKHDIKIRKEQQSGEMNIFDSRTFGEIENRKIPANMDRKKEET